MNTRSFTIALALLGVGCGSRAVRDLSKAEQDYLVAVTHRVDEHRSAVERMLVDLGAIERQFAAVERQNTMTAVAEAKLLESMQAPWAAPSPSLETTQRAVILFHLYDLLAQQRALFEAEQDQRDEERQQVLAAYDKLAELLNETLADEKIVLEYLNQPASSQIASVVEQTLLEAHAASDSLAKSDDPRLQRLAAETDKISDRVERTKKAIQDALAAAEGAANAGKVVKK
jgi:hypothetical protein